jgi:hypothetical protein
MKPALLLLTVALAGRAQESAPPRPQIRASAEAVIRARPDQAQIEVGVSSQAATAQAAAMQNAAQLDGVLSRLRKILGQRAEIRTAAYSLVPNYRYPREGGKPEIVSYTATNILLIESRDLEELGSLIDAATQAGANTIHSLRFLLRNEDTVRLEALRQATQKARANAEAMAAAAGMKILRVIWIEQTQAPGFRPMHEIALARAAEVAAPSATPIEAGTIEVRASVTLVAEVAPSGPVSDR